MGKTVACARAIGTRELYGRRMRAAAAYGFLWLLTACRGEDTSSIGSDAGTAPEFQPEQRPGEAVVDDRRAAAGSGQRDDAQSSLGVSAAGSSAQAAAAEGHEAGRPAADADQADADGGKSAGAAGRAAAEKGAGGTGGTGGKAGSGGMDAARGPDADGGKGAAAPAQPLWVGRVDASDSSAVRLTWQGAGFIANLTGPKVAVKLRTEELEEVYFQLVIDGHEDKRFAVPSGDDLEVMLADDLSPGAHRIELYRDTEGTYGVSTFFGFTAGTLQPMPERATRFVEIVGDSISAGYGNLGSERHPNGVATPGCGWTAENSTWWQSYGAIAGRAFSAEVSTVACSGWGLYRDNEGKRERVMPSVYDNTLGGEPEPLWSFQPEASVVVINLGTNDWSMSDPGRPFETTYSSFLDHVRSRNPHAWIFLTIGSTLDPGKLNMVTARLRTVVDARTAAGDDKIATFDLGIQPLGDDGEIPTGCGWHPNVADHQRMAEILKKQLASKLGW
jgi:lysophospholipase L1-like esterase